MINTESKLPMLSDREKQLDAWLALSGQTPLTATSVRLPMLSGSMAPAIPMGTVMEIVVEPQRHCQAGEVIVFQAGDKLIAHRILFVLRIGSWQWVLEKGDANSGGSWRPNSLVRGRVVGIAEVAAGPVVDPTNRSLARRGLYRHLRHNLCTLGGLRPNSTSEQQHDD